MQKIARRALVASGFALLCLAAPARRRKPRACGARSSASTATCMSSRPATANGKVALDRQAAVRGDGQGQHGRHQARHVRRLDRDARPDGSLRAVEVHIFPEAMRGTGEGHRPWDLEPQATMTNANVEAAVTGVNGQTLTMKYKGGEKKLVVTPETVVVAYAPGDKAEVKPGTGIFYRRAEKKPDGTLQTPRITYGKDGLMPPM